MMDVSAFDIWRFSFR